MMERSSWLILGAAVLAGALGGFLQHRQQSAAHKDATEIGEAAPTPLLSGLDGKQHDLDEYHGHRVLINFWASWCGPCLDEMPALARAQHKFGDRGGTVIGIAMDDPLRTRNFVVAHPPGYPILLGRLEPPSTSLQFGDRTGMLPYSVLLDTRGRVLATHLGALPADEMMQWLAPDDIR